MNITETIKFMIDNTAGVDIDDLIQHLSNIKNNQIITINDEVEIPVEEKQETPVEIPKHKERIMCNECNIYIVKSTKSRHYKTKKHLKNAEKNNEKQAEETKLMELEDININEIPPPIPAVIEVPEYKKSFYHLWDELDDRPDEDGYLMYRIFYDPAISDEELLKYHPDLKTDRFLFIKYRVNYTIVYYPVNIGKRPPPNKEPMYSEEEFEKIKNKYCMINDEKINKQRYFHSNIRDATIYLGFNYCSNCLNHYFKRAF
jgi:hypothetical protein